MCPWWDKQTCRAWSGSWSERLAWAVSEYIGIFVRYIFELAKIFIYSFGPKKDVQLFEIYKIITIGATSIQQIRLHTENQHPRLPTTALIRIILGVVFFLQII